MASRDLAALILLAVFNWYRTLPCRVSDKRFSDTAGRLMWRRGGLRQIRSSFLRSPTLTATLVCSEKPATPSAVSMNGSSEPGKVCKVKTLRPFCGPTAMR